MLAKLIYSLANSIKELALLLKCPAQQLHGLVVLSLPLALSFLPDKVL